MYQASPGPEVERNTLQTDGASSGDEIAPPGATRPVHFVADAHLGIEAESVEQAKARDLVSFIDHLVGRSSLLYLVGDIFDFWFEYPWARPHEHGDVLAALRRLVDSGTPVRFLGGNHDYWAGRRFEELTGASVHRTPVTTEHFGKRVFIAHGDGLPRGDLGYKMLKAVIRSRVAIAGFTLIPPRSGAAIARWASGMSEVTEERIDRATPAMHDFLEHKLAEGYDVAIVGHIHRQMVWKYGGGTAVVIGDWMKRRSAIELTEDGIRPLRWTAEALVEEEPAA